MPHFKALLVFVVFLFLPAFAQADKDARPITNCARAGDICSDATIFMGLYCPDEGRNFDSCAMLYTVPYNHDSAVSWRAGASRNDIANDSLEDGSRNQKQVRIDDSFPALNICKSLNYASHTDWYVPARSELAYMIENQRFIANLEDGVYWSSSEINSSQAWAVDFTRKQFQQHSKSQERLVRCIRRVKP